MPCGHARTHFPSAHGPFSFLLFFGSRNSLGTSFGPRGAALPGAPAHPPPAAAPPAPRPEAAADSGDPRPARPEPHLLLALAAETQARSPLLVAVAVIGASLVRLELHHPPGPGGGAVRVAGVEGGEPAPDGGARARPRLGQGKQGGGAASLLHGSAAGPPRLPHSPRPRPRAAAAVTAAVAAAATAAAPSAAATPDDDRAAILGALRQQRKAARACGTAARSQRRPRPGIAPSQSARRKLASGMKGPCEWRRPQRWERRGGEGGARGGSRGRKGCGLRVPGLD